ncbi:MAG: hypothetical protein IKR06_02690 [Erysipelotrichaceae bacterium]|nr:hypothetical protein [Erysipelotrichaceae bacterium]
MAKHQMSLILLRLREWYGSKYGEYLDDDMISEDICIEFIDDTIYTQRGKINVPKYQSEAKFLRDAIDTINDEYGYNITEDDTAIMEPFDVICPKCGIAADFIKANEGDISKARSRYRCPKCRMSVMTHPGTPIPLGDMANAKIRSERILLHEKFDRLYVKMHWSRKEAYEWMARNLGIPPERAHISMLTEEECEELRNLLKEMEERWFIS